MSSKQARFNLHLPGLLEVLAGSLYSSPKVGLRELIQNAHDSCTRRQVEQAERFYRPKIEIFVSEEDETLTIRDNGQGLTDEQITDYLATIGRSYTGQLKNELAILDPERAKELIGQFGFGFLSAFLIADEIVLTTRSIEPDFPAYKWYSAGGEFYELTRIETEPPPPIGTSITLQVKPGFSFVFDPEILEETVQQFADFLPVPIFVNGSKTSINLTRPPWEAADPAGETLRYIQRTFYEAAPLCVIPLHDQELPLEDGDSLHIPLQGFLFIPPSSTVSVHEYGDLNIYIRRMFICDQEKKLLPNWAKFVRGVIDCPYLQPTASRESLHQDEFFGRVRQALELQLGQALQHIAENNPTLWKAIIYGHASLITGWAVRDDHFFKQVADLMMFRTSRGDMTLPEYLQHSPNSFYFLTRHLGALQEQLLAEGHDAPVIDAHWFAIEPFLRKYVAWSQKEIKLVQMDGDISQLFRPEPNPAPFAPLLTFYQNQAIRAQVVQFKPTDVPALMVYPADAEARLETKKALDQNELPSPFANFVSDFVQQTGGLSDEELKGTLYLNTACPLIQKLAHFPPPAASLEATLMLLYQVARLFSGRTLSPADAVQAFRHTTQALTHLTRPTQE